MENIGSSISGTAVFGLNTNAWDPSIELDPPPPYISAPFPIAPGQLIFTNASVYVNQAVGPAGTNIVRVVYLQDTSGPNILPVSILTPPASPLASAM